MHACVEHIQPDVILNTILSTHLPCSNPNRHLFRRNAGGWDKEFVQLDGISTWQAVCRTRTAKAVAAALRQRIDGEPLSQHTKNTKVTPTKKARRTP